MIKINPLKNYFNIELKNISSFYIVLFIAGILTALSFSVGESVFVHLITSLIILLGFTYRFRFLKPIVYFLFFFTLGLAVMTYRINHTQTPMISKPLYNIELTGTVLDSSSLFNAQKIILSNVRFLNHPTSQTPTKIKLTYSKTTPLLKTGDTVKVRAFLRPPMPPVIPDMYHEKRMSFFQGIGAIGKIDSILEVRPNSSSFYSNLTSVRQTIADRIQSAMPEETARVAIPLTIGEQGVVSEHLYTIFRSAGIIHVLSVSGFHLSLLAAFIFFLTRSLLSFFPYIVEHFSTKKIAAVIALIIAGCYILISGMQAPAIRSFIMLAIVLIALLFNRNALSVRSLSIAAFVILFFAPDMILNIGFQLSFTAVLVLTTLYPQLRLWLFPDKPTSFVRRFFVLLGCLLLLDFLITLTTLPLTVYHFKQLAPYTLIGNLLTTAVLSFWIMPLLFLGLILIPFGLETVFFKAAAVGLSYVIGLCEQITNLPYSLITISPFNLTGLLFIIGGILLICLMKTRLRFIGMFIILIGFIISFQSERPSLLIGDKGQTVAVYQDKELRFLSRAQNDWTARNWLSYYGQSETPEILGIPNVLYLNGKRISFHSKTCPNADLCLLAHPNPKEKNALSLFENGVRLFYIDSEKIRIKKIAF